MERLEIIAPLSQSKAVFDYLQLCGQVELCSCDETDGLNHISSGRTVAQLNKMREAAEAALKTLDSYSPAKSGLLDSFKDKPQLTESEYYKKCNQADEFIGLCYDINDLSKKIADSKSQIAKLESQKDALYPWLNLDVPMKLSETDKTSVFIGTLTKGFTKEEFDEAFGNAVGEETYFESCIISSTRDKTLVALICLKQNKDEIYSTLRQFGFAYPSDPTSHPPEYRYNKLNDRISELRKIISTSEDEIRKHSDIRNDIEFVIDYLISRTDKYEGLEKVSSGQNFIVISGYTPAKYAGKLIESLNERFTVCCSAFPVSENDDVPAAFENRSFAAAVEPITEMYSMPGKNDVDPNPVMAFFYYMLFGIMLSDAGYGLLMAIGCGIAKFVFKPAGKLKKTVDMYFYCGLATVFWGALFGSWFGDIITRVAQQFFDIPNIGEVWNQALGFTLFRENVAIWFEPVNNPTKLLLFSFLFGIVHLFFGVGASFVKMWKCNNKVGAFCDCIPVFLLITGIAPIGANIISADTFSSEITSVFKWIALAGAVLIIATSGRDSRNIVGKLGLGLYGLYNAASGWMSDILSYSRLLALGLCTGVIATVINVLGTIPEDKTVKLILLIPVFIFGHLVNMAINLIGTYVHTNRLQYVEFFAKFYEGGGRSFTPFKLKSDYYTVKEEK